MTDNEKRIFIAEACPGIWENRGYTWSDSGYLSSGEEMQTVDPFYSLDLMHEAEKVLSETQLREYHDVLEGQMIASVGYGEWVMPWRATARQRAEAFIETLKTEKAKS